MHSCYALLTVLNKPKQPHNEPLQKLSMDNYFDVPKILGVKNYRGTSTPLNSLCRRRVCTLSMEAYRMAYHGTWKWNKPSKMPQSTICRAVKPPPQNSPTPTHSTTVAANDTNGNRAMKFAQAPKTLHHGHNHQSNGSYILHTMLANSLKLTQN